MQFDIYLMETRQIAEENGQLLDEVRQRLLKQETLSRLEQIGVLHALQILIKNAIGKSKHWVKYLDRVAPVSAYDAFRVLADCQILSQEQAEQWKVVIGLRNKIVHDYMKLDVEIVLDLIRMDGNRFVVDFLNKPFG